MLSHQFLDHSHLLKTNQNFRQTICLFLVTPRGTVKFVTWPSKKKWKFNPSAVHHNVMYIKFRKSSEYGMTKSSTKSELVWCKLRNIFVKVLLFWVFGKPRNIFTDSCFSTFSYCVFHEIGLVTFWSMKIGLVTFDR